MSALNEIWANSSDDALLHFRVKMRVILLLEDHTRGVSGTADCFMGFVQLISEFYPG